MILEEQTAADAFEQIDRRVKEGALMRPSFTQESLFYAKKYRYFDMKRVSSFVRERSKLIRKRCSKSCMGRLIVHEKEGNLELDGFLLQVGDQLELRLLGFWYSGSLAHDRRGWYFLTQNRVGIRLQTGLAVRALSLSSVC